MTALARVSFGLLVAYWSLSWRIDRLTESKYDFLHGLVLFTAADDHEPIQSNTPPLQAHHCQALESRPHPYKATLLSHMRLHRKLTTPQAILPPHLNSSYSKTVSKYECDWLSQPSKSPAQTAGYKLPTHKSTPTHLHPHQCSYSHTTMRKTTPTHKAPPAVRW